MNSDDGASLPWTCDQWATVQRTAADAARRARVASSFLPLVGPLPEGQASVPALRMSEQAAEEAFYNTGKLRLQIDDGQTLRLATLSCEVFVRTQQAHDPDLASVQQMVARAAVVIGRLEDAVVLMGQPGPDLPPTEDRKPKGRRIVRPDIYRVQGGGRYRGLRQANSFAPVKVEDPGDPGGIGNALVQSVVKAIDELEERGQYGPFGCMLGHSLYEVAHRPSPGSLVLPADRFVPFLAGGPLLRSSVLTKNEGVIVATAGSPIDLVVASDVHVGFLQRSTEPRYVLRVSERLVLRIKQRDAVARLVAPGLPA